MSEAKNKELSQEAGGEELEKTPEKQESEAKTTQPQEDAAVEEVVEVAEDAKVAASEKKEQPSELAASAEADKAEEAEADVEEESEAEAEADAEEESEDENDIDAQNAEDAEDSENERRHHIPFLDYHELSMENLVGELQRLLRTEKVQAIRRHADTIKREFDQKFREFIDEKKEEFVSRGGNEIDFRYNSVTKRQFNELYSEYREKRNQYYKSRERNLKENLQTRLDLIEELKGLVHVEEDMTSTYNTFKEVQERWRNAGPVPRNSYNDVWRTYQHHVEIFYDFLHLNRELRDLDFKFNLEEKEKLIERAEALAQEPDLNKAFRELQTLHKLWKEELGPVAKDKRDEVWERFSAATKTIHERRQEHFKQLDARYETNLETKNEIIAKILGISEQVADNHRAIQGQIREVEALRESFFKAGKVPQKENEKTWAAFKGAVRAFNKKKNAFYKNLKKEQQENLDRKRALLKRAEELKESEAWEEATPEMKRIQQEWKQIGHVPRKFSDKIWKEFKAACNHYFNRLHSRKNADQAQHSKDLKVKEDILSELKEFQTGKDREADLKQLQEFLKRWKASGRLPRNRQHLDRKFQKIIDAIFRKLGVSKQEADLLRYGDKIKKLAKADDVRTIEEERQFIRRKIEENKGELRQLENNLNFFTDPSEDNPLVKEVIESIDKQKEALERWQEKLKKLNILRNNLEKEANPKEETEGADHEESAGEQTDKQSE
ncbi:DUF349 domain-containing protein [Robiginitalea myxolifaciens]|nr:DUF349 domain-containing protein [Robiginitalea myxolifaciens]